MLDVLTAHVKGILVNIEKEVDLITSRFSQNGPVVVSISDFTQLIKRADTIGSR